MWYSPTKEENTHSQHQLNMRFCPLDRAQVIGGLDAETRAMLPPPPALRPSNSERLIPLWAIQDG